MWPEEKILLAAAKEATLKEIGEKYKPQDYSGKAKAEMTKTISASKKTNTIKVKGKKVKVKVRAAGNKYYAVGTKTVTVKIVVK